MDAGQFDGLVQSVSERGSRRGVFGLLRTFVVLGGLALAGDDSATARGRRRKPTNKGNGHGKKKNRNKGRGNGQPHCQPEATATTCAGTCGPVKNNCQQTVDCGPCACDPPCGPCERCNGTSCVACASCCHDACCDADGAICHRESGDCCVPETHAQACEGKCGEIVDSCGVAVDCGPCSEGKTCATCAAYRDGVLYDRASDCCGELVCDCGQVLYYPPGGQVVECKRAGFCRPNRAPVALNLDFKLARQFRGDELRPIFLNGYESDDDFFTFRIVTQPVNGFLAYYNEVFMGEPGDPALPATPIAADAEMDCYPRCRLGRDCRQTSCADCSRGLCPEGWYKDEYIEYIPFSSTFTGTDSFTYAAVDLYGAEGPTALVTLMIFDA